VISALRRASPYGQKSKLVGNRFLRVPQEPLIERVVVQEGLDAADDWIAGRVGPRDIVITTDVPLVSRCVKAGATMIAPNGRPAR
jgi:uncharacterized protein